MRLKKYIIILLVLLVPLFYVLSCNSGNNPNIENVVTFKKQLSLYSLFSGKMSELNPCTGVELLELSSTLFTDYAEKQRLIRLPAGKKMILNGNELPEFPEGTLIAKTFYYPSKGGTRLQILETRLLLFSGSKWNVASYRWNKAQSEAFLIKDGATVPVIMQDLHGKVRRIAYHIPGKKECVSCHHSDNMILPIGPKVRNLNRDVQREGKVVNQLAYLMEKGLIQPTSINSFQRQQNYDDSRLHIEQRARAYLDINCAHCHRSGGYAGQTTLNLDYNTNLDHSGIKSHKNNIVIRMNEMGAYHMPKLGTTVIDKQGLELIIKYVKNLK